MNTAMIIRGEKEIYPQYMSNEEKEELKKQTDLDSETLYCACKAYLPDEEKLYYRISNDNRFIPCHHGYEHAEDCARYAGRRNSAYVSLDSAEGITVFLKFNPVNFSVPSVQKKEEATESGGDACKTAEKKIKEPYLSLSELIRSINIDCYMERLLRTGNVLSRDYFLSVIKGRLKKIKLSGCDKTLFNLSLNEDRCCFFYGGYKGSENNGEYYSRVLLQLGKKTYSYGIRSEILNAAVLEFAKNYGGETPDANDESVMAAGFIYKRVSRRTMKDYYTIGRIHIFKTTRHEGIYCRDNFEKEFFELVFRYKYFFKEDNVKLHIPVNPERYNAKISVGNSFGTIFKSKKGRGYECTYPYIECRYKAPQPETLKDFIEEIKREGGKKEKQ